MKIPSSILFIVSIIISISYSETYRILCVFPFNGKSHDVMFSALIKGLAKRNHQVDVITHYPLKNPPPNYKVVVNLNGTLVNKVNTLDFNYVQSLSGDITSFIAETSGNYICNLLGLEDMQKFIKNAPKYDVVMVEVFGANCFLGIGHLLGVPIVGVSSTIEYPWISCMTGNFDNLALVPSSILTVFDSTKFWDRLTNVFSYYYNVYKFNSLTEKPQTDLMRKYLSPDMPSIRDVEKSIALTLVNKHPVINGAHPVSQSVIEVSGLHIVEETKLKLPWDLQKWLDESVDGVVYFTFGSMVLIETLPVHTINAIYRSLEKIAPIRVLLKIADKKKLPPGLPKNVLTSAWIPQQSVLAHKNIRTFITHGGMMGCQEALYHGVPMVGIPLFADQAQNVRTFVAKNMTRLIKYKNLTTASLDEALDAVLNNPMYRNNAKLNSKLFRDRPMKAMDTAAFWIEFAARNGPNVLRSSALELKWWQITLLDIYGFILLSLILALLLTYSLIRLLVRLILRLKLKLKHTKLD